MYTFTEHVDWETHFHFDINLIENISWARLPKAAKSVFPVIGCFCNERGYAYPSERTIAILSGRTDKTVRSGVQALRMLPPFTQAYYVTDKNRRAKRFHIQPQEDTSFIFHKCLLEKGLWQQLPSSAQALYPVLRALGYYNDETCSSYNVTIQDEDNRDFDFCDTTDTKLIAKLAGISPQSVLPANKHLRGCGLLEPVEQDAGGNTFIWKVFFKTENWFSRELLNNKVTARYSKH